VEAVKSPPPGSRPAHTSTLVPLGKPTRSAIPARQDTRLPWGGGRVTTTATTNRGAPPSSHNTPRQGSPGRGLPPARHGKKHSLVALLLQPVEAGQRGEDQVASFATRLSSQA
jgi:hypothetical protein